MSDEVVDTFPSNHSNAQLDELEQDLYRAVSSGFSTNPIVYSFANTIRTFDIDLEYVKAFMDSMKMDIEKSTYTQKELDCYIYGSAEVIGLICLDIFVDGDKSKFDNLRSGALKLGSIYQRVNFLRDYSEDKNELGRIYFPQIEDGIDESSKQEIINSIKTDLLIVRQIINNLPRSSRYAVLVSYLYYSELVNKIDSAPINDLIHSRIRLTKPEKILLLASVYCRKLLHL